MFKIPLKQKQRQILHIDADAFFASVEQVLNPDLRGKAILVGGPSEKHGIVSAASYEAKKFGIHSGMAMYLARRKCPHAITIPAHFDAYREFSRRMYRIFNEYTDSVEMASIDEAYLDITGLEVLHRAPAHIIAKKILIHIYKKLGLSVSCGLSSNKTVAKVASSTNKPHKLTYVPFGMERAFLSQLPLRALPGIGPKTHALFNKYGLKILGDLSSLTSREVIDKFGISIIPLWKRSMGIDNTPVISLRNLPKSISKERTFYHEQAFAPMHLKILRELGGIVFAKLRAYDMKANKVFVKIKYRDDTSGKYPFQSFSFQMPMGIPSSADGELFSAVKALFLKNISKNRPIRLIGMGVGNLAKIYNLSLFERDQDKDKLFFAVDKLKELYGGQAVSYGA